MKEKNKLYYFVVVWIRFLATELIYALYIRLNPKLALSKEICWNIKKLENNSVCSSKLYNKILETTNNFIYNLPVSPQIVLAVGSRITKQIWIKRCSIASF